MAPKINVKEKVRDEEFGVMKKEVSLFNVPSFETPTKCVKNLSPTVPQTVSINEVTKRIYPHTVESIWNGTDLPRSIKPKWLPNKLNLTIFELRLDSIPEPKKIRSLASYWYAASQSTLFLPTVKSTMLKEGTKLSEKKIYDCLGMMKDLMETTEGIGNFKAFIGTVPLLPAKYSKPILDFYLDRGITAFAVDMGTKDLLNNEGDFRYILAEINAMVPLSTAFIYACNLGIPQFELNKARADDFLSLFAYVDAFGTTFKTKGGVGMPVYRPRAKKFLRTELSYEYLSDTSDYLRDFNQKEQLKEADVVRTLIGVERVRTYLKTKNAVDESAMKHLGSIAQKVKVD